MFKTYPNIPADVPRSKQPTYFKNYAAITQESERLMLFAYDQKIEHLNTDFYGKNISPETLNPETAFQIAQEGDIGAFATHPGLIARYGKSYPNLNYIAKLNGKTNLVPTKQKDPLSTVLWSINSILEMKEQYNINICGIGYTIYLGSEYEATMLTQAAHLISEAHKQGLVTILWVYPRGKSIGTKKRPELAAGATGVAVNLGSDFVKIQPPTTTNWLNIAVQAAGNTKVICSGGPSKDPKEFLEILYSQIHTAGTAGSATGRNIFQKPLHQAIAFTKAISAIVHQGKDAITALNIYEASL